MKQIAWDEVMKRLEVASKICNDASPVQVEGPIHVGVDLGTADVVVMAVDDNGMPVSAFLEWATVVRDGVVVDYHGAITIVKRLVSMTEERLGRKITEASTSYPPGTDARLSTNILDAANLRLVSTADEPSCLARLARLDRAAVVDIGGGTTGTAVISNGKVIASVDDATGGHHVTLAMSGALSVPYEDAELKKRGLDPKPEIMIPLVSVLPELEKLRRVAEEAIAEVAAEQGIELDIPVGTMIELPRAAVTADEIATQADFFSFGTNDLTQTTFGFSRDDVEAEFVPQYLAERLLPYNPFATIDPGVAKLVEMGVELGHKGNPDIVCGVCGEHGGDPDSVKMFHKIGLDYVSCSPYRVPLARLAAGQAALAEKMGDARDK